MDFDIIIGIMINTLILISLSLIYSLLPVRNTKNNIGRQMLLGVYISIVGLAIMNTPFEFQNGVFFDTRSILISSSGMFLGFIPTIIGSIILIVYRLYLGGAGMYTGALVVGTSAIIGLLWRRYRLKRIEIEKIESYELLIIGFIVHFVMLVAMYTLPVEVRHMIIDSIWFAIVFIYPIGAFLIYRFFLYQRKGFYQKIKTKESEKQYRYLFEKSKVILLLIDADNGDIIDANELATSFYGWDLSTLKSMKVQEINTLPEEEVMSHLQECRSKDKSYFNFRHHTKDKGIIDVEIYSGPIEIAGKEYLLSTIIDITEKKQRELELTKQQEELRYVSHHDYLTGLYNRYFFEEELSRLNTKRQLPLSIIMGDVNGLKLINDTFSHLEGDELLKEIGRIFRQAVRQEDIVARWGGDEFVILLPQTPNEVASRICDTISSLCQESNYPIITPNIALGYHTQEEIGENVYESLKKAEEQMYRTKLLQGKSMRNSLIASLESTLSEKSYETKKHATNMISLSKTFAKQLGLSKDDENTLTLIARLHDIGKISISDTVLSKIGKLNEEEWNEIKGHSAAGGRIVNSIPELMHISDAIIHHHEWYDGSGYPNGLKQDLIPLNSRIISIVDAYEVMTNGRVYKPKMTHEEALEELIKFKGVQFDPYLVDEFIDAISKKEI